MAVSGQALIQNPGGPDGGPNTTTHTETQGQTEGRQLEHHHAWMPGSAHRAYERPGANPDLARLTVIPPGNL